MCAGSATSSESVFTSLGPSALRRCGLLRAMLHWRNTKLALSAIAVASLVWPAGVSAARTANLGTVENPHMDDNTLRRGCGSCHRGHGLSGTALLPERDSEACLMCHGGVESDVVGDIAPSARARLRDLRAEFKKPYRHPVETSWLHSRGETLPERDPGALRHVSCLDCHGAHDTPMPRRTDPVTLATRPRAATLKGVAYEFELCYRCHGDAANLPYAFSDIRARMHAGNESFHPVESPGRSSRVPSLRAPYSPSSVISCTDCHGSDEPAGRHAPHGSVHAGLLIDNYSTRDGGLESAVAYGICYRCHDRSSILADRSFSEHRSHVVGPDSQTSCHTCHDSHGSRHSPHLIEFNPTVVSPTRRGMVRYRQTKALNGECYLTCHGVEHDPARYCPIGSGCDPGILTSLSNQMTSPLRSATPRPVSPFDSQRPRMPSPETPR